ncbi:MAG TPA: glycosyltransferase family 39 protein, partial [Chloroflexota bacterium]|nr:glycosyltransferase family 39 protein [Chloroflexota bacterium]
MHPRACSLALSCGLFLLIAGQFFWVTPILETSDATGHYQYIRSLARQGQFPALPSPDPLYSAGEEAGQFPLYYLIGAALVKPFSDADLDAVYIPDPHNNAGAGLTKNYAFHRPFNGFPHGAELSVRIVELFSLACGALTVACCVLLARLYRPRQPGLWLATGCAAAVLPSFVFLSSGVSNDNLVTALSALTMVLLAAWLLDGRDRWSWLAAVSLWLAVLAKFNAVGLLGCYVLVLGWRTRSLRGWLTGLAKLAGAGVVLDGWWFARNVQLYGEPSGLLALNHEIYGAGYAPFHVTLTGAFRHIASELPKAFHSFFVAFGHYNIDAPPAFVLVAALGG